MDNPLTELQKWNQSVWLDYIRRSFITSGELRKLVEQDGLRGVTSNPTIFEKAIDGSNDYDQDLRSLLDQDPRKDQLALFESLAVQDIRMAADVLRPAYEKTSGGDGFVSIEVRPGLANDTRQTIAEARRLWKMVDRPNLMVKVPATPAGIPAIETLTAEGININITLMFSLEHYEAVANAYIHGIERCGEPHRVSSVASLFVSRIDTAVDSSLEAIGTAEAMALRGKVAIALMKVTYQKFREIFVTGERFARVSKRGARIQRPLWASTGTKNPAYSDVLYVEELIGADTISTMPPATMEAFRDHGKVRGETVRENLDEAQHVLDSLQRLGVDLHSETEKIQRDGVDSFAASFDKLMRALDKKRSSLAVAGTGRLGW